jgi:predicted SprT family Zn-dependent metalloprotease
VTPIDEPVSRVTGASCDAPHAGARREDARALTAELEGAALRELRREWLHANETFFRGRMRPPHLVLSDARSRFGQWRRGERTLEIARRLLLEQGWGSVVEVLRHEMAHQFVDEVLGVHDESAHGPAFRAVCAEHGIDARATGAPAASRVDGEQHLLERIAKLLALAESANEHEAQVAAAAAQRLMLKYNLDARTRAGVRDYAFRHLGRPTGRVQEAERILASILGDHFFVEVIWVPVWRPLEGKRGSVLEACGTPENLDLAEYVHGFLLHTAERLWHDPRRHGLAGRQRRAYLAGVMRGFKDKLEAETAGHRQAGLVWVGDAVLSAYFRRRHPRVRWTRRLSSERQAAHAEGRAAGRDIVLHRGVSAGPSSELPRLPPRR